MPVVFKMADGKTEAGNPVVIAEETAAVVKPNYKKRYVIIAVCAVLAVVIILTAILVGMWMFTEAEKEIIKYRLNVDKNMKEDVTSDPNDNVVTYHVEDKEYEMWIMNDFNRDIQVTKVKTDSGTNCYAHPLNRTESADPSKFKTPSSDSDVAKRNATEQLMFDVSGTPIPDTLFLSKTVRDACKGTSVYWLYPKCKDSAETGIQKRAICIRCYYYYTYVYYYGWWSYILRYTCYYYNSYYYYC